MVTPAARREAVAHLRGRLGVSERRACSIIGADRTSIRYRSRRSDDTALRVRLRELASSVDVQLSAAAHFAAARLREDQPQEDTAALHRGKTDGTQT